MSIELAKSDPDAESAPERPPYALALTSEANDPERECPAANASSPKCRLATFEEESTASRTITRKGGTASGNRKRNCVTLCLSLKTDRRLAAIRPALQVCSVRSPWSLRSRCRNLRNRRPPASLTLLSAAQLDQLTAPIALYPDPLLGQILAVATYPLEIVEAARWLEDPAHTVLKGSELAAALEPLPWDQSVKSLVPFPEVLRNLNSNLEWTEQLGDAFLAQQADVMDSVQRLRQRAAAAGSLRSTPQQIVTDQDNEIGWWGWNWPGHGFVVYPPTGALPAAWSGRSSAPRCGARSVLAADPGHRRGVPYRDVAAATRYLGPQGASARPYRGYPPSPAVRPQRP